VFVPPTIAQPPIKSRTKILASVDAEKEEPTILMPLLVNASQKSVMKIKLGMLPLASASATWPLLVVPLVRFGTIRLVAALSAVLNARCLIRLEQPVCALTLLPQMDVELVGTGVILLAVVSAQLCLPHALPTNFSTKIPANANLNAPKTKSQMPLTLFANAAMLPQLADAAAPIQTLPGMLISADVNARQHLPLVILDSNGARIAVHAESSVWNQSDPTQPEHLAFAPTLPQPALVLSIVCGMILPADATALLFRQFVLPTSSGMLRNAAVCAT
jgi:hypothetical protein